MTVLKQCTRNLHYDKIGSEIKCVEAEIPFEVPDSWCWARIGTIADTVLGKMLDASKNKGRLQPYLRNINVRWGDFSLDNLLLMRFEENEKTRYSVTKGDLIVCEGGEPGRCAVWHIDNTDILINTTFC